MAKALPVKRPRGRAPKGQEWDGLNGNWVEEARTRTKGGKGICGSRVKRSDANGTFLGGCNL